MKKPVWRLLNPNTIWYFVVMLLFAASAAVLRQYYLAGGALLATVIVFIISRAQLSRRKRELMSYVQKATDSAGISVHAGSAFPMAVIRLPDNEIIWGNPSFFAITGLSDTACYQTLDSVISGFSTSWLREGQSELPGDRIIGGRRYRIYGNYVRSEDDATTVQLATIYFADMTEMFNVRDEFMRTRPIVSIVLIDNYDELTANLSDSAVSTLDAQLNDVIANWTAGLEALCRKTERNRYLVIFESKDLAKLQENRFSVLLDDVRHVSSSSGMSATISLGIGKDGGSFAENYRFAALAIEMSLSRGGDQAVVKDRVNFEFYGGRSKSTEKRTKVKSRVMANALGELIDDAKQVYVMGHKYADMDSLGAAVGICCIARKRGKPCQIIIDTENNAAHPILRRLSEQPEYANTAISGQDAFIKCQPGSLLVVVDTNRPESVESEEMLETCNRVAVIDHHRRGSSYIEKMALNYHEPYASSASELVAELMQYLVEPSDVLKCEAEALLSGIVLDTKNFTNRTGGRTFEAAAYLRRLGADTQDVQRMFQGDLKSMIARYDIIRQAQLYRGDLAIAALDTTCDRVTAAKAADELLTLKGIRASFVLYPKDQGVYISARSLGEVNVQVIVEALGGGGNSTTAGGQLNTPNIAVARTALLRAIDEYFEK